MVAAVLASVLLAGCGTSQEAVPDAAAPMTSAATTPRGDAGDGGAAQVDDGGGLGSAGRALLSPASPSAAVEVDRSPGADLAVDPAAIIAGHLREHGGKRTVDSGGDSQAPAREVYSEADLRAIASASRSIASAPERPAVYVLVLEGRFTDEKVAGVAFDATAFAIFPGQLGGGVLGLHRQAFERALVTHELGHLFGLVDLTGEGGFHEDPEHPGHSAAKGSVMYWAVEQVSVRSVFAGGPPTDFDAQDLEEMAKIRS